MSNLDQLVELISQKSLFQKKRVKKYLSKCDPEFFATAEVFLKDYDGFLKSHDIPFEYAVDSYLKMCDDMMKTQIHFWKTGKYPVDFQEEAFKNTYNNKEEMMPYMVGVAMSQMLWVNHYKMFTFFKKAMKEKGAGISSYLEIGPGHGLYLNEAVRRLKKDARISAVDISPTSIDMTRSVMKYFNAEDAARINFHNMNIFDAELKEKFEFIAMGEVLEHVNFPDKLLCKLRELLAPKGRLYVSTCANAPAIDHVYHYKSIDEIREQIDQCGLNIESELIAPTEDLPMEELIEKKIAISYCAITTSKSGE